MLSNLKSVAGYLFLAFLSFCFQLGFSQNPSVYTMSQFFPEKEINRTEITQAVEDDHGYLWFIENEQLFRFDGNECETQLDSTIAVLSIKTSGEAIHILTNKGIAIIDATNSKYSSKNLTYKGEISGGLSIDNGWLCYGSNGSKTWIQEFDSKGKLLHTNELDLAGVKSIMPFKGEFVVRADQYYSYIKGSNQFNSLMILGVETPFQILKTHNNKIVVRDEKNKAWLIEDSSKVFLTNDKIHGVDFFNDDVVYTTTSNLFTYVTNGEVQPLLEVGLGGAYNDNDAILHSTKSGLWTFERNAMYKIKKSSSIIKYTTIKGFDKLGYPVGIKQSYKPKDGKYYYAAVGEGVLKIRKEDDYIERLIDIPGKGKKKNTLLLHERDGYLYQYNFSGIGRLDLKTGKNVSILDPFKLAGSNVINGSDYLNGFHFTEKYLWVNTKSYKLYRYNFKTKQIKTYNIGRVIQKDNALIFETISSKNRPITVLNREGVFCYDKEKDTFVSSKTVYPKLVFQPNVKLSGIKYIGDRYLVISSFNAGIYTYDIENDSMFRPLDQKFNELEVSDIYVDSKSRLWGSTKSGLLLYKVETNSARLFTNKDGLVVNSTYYKYPKEDLDGNITLGYVNSYATFDPEKLINTKRGVLLLNSIKINQVVKGGKFRVWNEKRISLNYDENSIFIDVKNKNLEVLEGGDLQYRLVGLNSSWNYSKTNPISFIGLQPGNYTFEARAGVDAPISSCQIRIYSPFWKTWWFNLLLLLLVAGVLFFIFRLKMDSIRNEATLEQKYKSDVHALEIQALQSQMNSHFIFNSLNSIKSFIANNEPRKATKYLNKFALLIRFTLNSTKNKTINLDTEIKTISSYLDLEQLRFEDKFSYNISIDDYINLLDVHVPPLLIQPFLENAVWHGIMHKKGLGGHIEVVFKLKDNILKAEVIDNGVGRKKAAELNNKSKIHKSYGIDITNDRLKHLKKNSKDSYKAVVIDLYDDDNKPIGTKVEISIPISE